MKALVDAKNGEYDEIFTCESVRAIIEYRWSPIKWYIFKSLALPYGLYILFY